jgi:hypothetical protein
MSWREGLAWLAVWALAVAPGAGIAALPWLWPLTQGR